MCLSELDSEATYEVCPVCDGDGALPTGHVCQRCGGDGLIPHIHMALDPDGEAVEIDVVAA